MVRIDKSNKVAIVFAWAVCFHRWGTSIFFPFLGPCAHQCGDPSIAQFVSSPHCLMSSLLMGKSVQQLNLPSLLSKNSTIPKVHRDPSWEQVGTMGGVPTALYLLKVFYPEKINNKGYVKKASGNNNLEKKMSNSKFPFRMFWVSQGINCRTIWLRVPYKCLLKPLLPIVLAMASNGVGDGQLTEFHREMGQQRGVWKSIRFSAVNLKMQSLYVSAWGLMDLGGSSDHITLRMI